MGMRLALVALSDVNVARVLRDPPLVWRVIAPDDPEPYERARAESAKPGLLSKVFGGGGGRRGDSPPDLQLAEPEGLETDLDKAWHGIHYLLTGTAWEGEPPYNFLLGGGKEAGDVDVGYGPARVLTSAETRDALTAMQPLQPEELRKRFDPKDMIAKEIYPQIWDRDPQDDDTLGYLLEYFEILRGYLTQVVDEGLGVVVFIS